jgi:lipopolysaccharide export system permease protein
MAALRACGLGSGWVYRAVLIVALPLSVVVAGLSLYGRPLAYTQSYWLKARAQAAFELDNLRAGSFYETREGGGIVFAQAVDHESGVMHGVFVKSEHGQRVRVTYAREARYRVEAGSGERVLALADARVTELGRSEDGGQVVLRTPELVIRLPAAEVVPPGYKRKAATTASLLGSPRPADAAELQWRLSTPVSTALLALLGVPLGQVHPRQGKYGKLLLAVALYAVYFNLTGVARTWVEQGAVGAVPGIWWVPALLALVLAGAVLREPLQRLRRSR